MITKVNLAKLVSEKNAKKYFDYLIKFTTKYEINTKTRFAYFLSQIIHESGAFTIGAENLSYNTFSRIQLIFKGSRSSLISTALVRNPVLLGNTMYGGVWGKRNLGNTQEGDGFKFRGRGLIQVTGRGNYYRLSMQVFGDTRLIENPDLLLEPATNMECAANDFVHSGCNIDADNNDFNSCTRHINGGLTNLADRVQILGQVKKLI